MNYDRPALIVTGPNDGELILHGNPILEIVTLDAPVRTILKFADMAVCDEPLPVEKLTFKRITYKIAMSFDLLDCYVPIEWTQGSDSDEFVGQMILGHLLKKAFKGA